MALSQGLANLPDTKPPKPTPGARGRFPSRPEGNPHGLVDRDLLEQERARRLVLEQEANEREVRLERLEALVERALQKPASVEVEPAPASEARKNEELGRAIRTILKQFAALIVTAALGGAGALVGSKKLEGDTAATAATVRKIDEARLKELEEANAKFAEREAARTKYEQEWQAYQLELLRAAGVKVATPEGLPNPPDLKTVREPRAKGLGLEVQTPPPRAP